MIVSGVLLLETKVVVHERGQGGAAAKGRRRVVVASLLLCLQSSFVPESLVEPVEKASSHVPRLALLLVPSSRDI